LGLVYPGPTRSNSRDGASIADIAAYARP